MVRGFVLHLLARGVVALVALVVLSPGMGMPEAYAYNGGNALYEILLKRNVDDGLVDYVGLKINEADLDNYLLLMELVDADGLSHDEQLAYYINLYNAWTLKLVLMNYPGIDSIKDIGWLLNGPWDQEIVRTANGVITLGYLEHDILGKMGDPRVHFALTTASLGSPPLIDTPYEGSRIDEMLDEATRNFVNNPVANDLEGNTLSLSKIFDWYADEFADGVVKFILEYAEGSFRRELQMVQDTVKIEYLSYDWDLNVQPQ